MVLLLRVSLPWFDVSMAIELSQNKHLSKCSLHVKDVHYNRMSAKKH